jgi:hypothetical protein
MGGRGELGRAHRRESAPRGAIIPIRCAEEGCGNESILGLPGSPPYDMAGFVEKGWLAMSTPMDDEVVFLCPKCAKGLIREAEKDLGVKLSPQAKKVSG